MLNLIMKSKECESKPHELNELPTIWANTGLLVAGVADEEVPRTLAPIGTVFMCQQVCDVWILSLTFQASVPTRQKCRHALGDATGKFVSSTVHNLPVWKRPQHLRGEEMK